MIWKEQTEPYNYNINFVVNYPHLKSISCYKNDDLIYTEQYLEESNAGSFIYSYDSSEDIEVTEETPIIPEDTFHIIVETYDEYIISKGFPENDEILSNIYDRDIRLYQEKHIKKPKIMPTPNHHTTTELLKMIITT